MGTLNGLSRLMELLLLHSVLEKEISLIAGSSYTGNYRGPELFFMDKDNWRVSRVLRLEEGLLCGFYR